MLKLSVGCGSRPTGNVNLDLNTGKRVHHTFADYDVKKFKNFIKGSATHLPFRDKAFDELHALHLIEHIPTPLMAIKEFARVSMKSYIAVPNNPVFSEFNLHYFAWSAVSFQTFLELAFDHVEVVVQSSYYQLIEFKPFRLLMRLGVLKQMFQRMIGRLIGVELMGICV